MLATLYIGYLDWMKSASSKQTSRPCYRINQTAAFEGQQAGEPTRSVSVLIHLPNEVRNVNLTEEIFGGKVCTFNETHSQTSENLGRYLKLAPAAPSPFHEHQFSNALVNFDRSVSHNSQ